MSFSGTSCSPIITIGYDDGCGVAHRSPLPPQGDGWNLSGGGAGSFVAAEVGSRFRLGSLSRSGTVLSSERLD